MGPTEGLGPIPTPAIRGVVLLLVSAAACEGRSTLQNANTARDSAGVRIVENVQATWGSPWEVDGEPALTIGSIAGNPDQELDQVVGAVRLAEDRIVVANGGRLELLFYDGSGHLLGRSGGRGEGPGEFQSLEWLSRWGSDSILVLDIRNHRVSFFDGTGSFGRSVRLTPNAELPFPPPVGFFADGSFLASPGTFSLSGSPPASRAERTFGPLSPSRLGKSKPSRIRSSPRRAPLPDPG